MWYTVALGVTVLTFGGLLYLERRQSSLRELDQRLALEADLATRWLSESYNVLGRIVTTAGTSPSLDPGISAYLEAVRDYLVVTDTTGKVLALSEAARTLSADALESLTQPLDSLRLPSSARHCRWAEGGRARYLAVRVEAAGPEIGGLLVATPIDQAALGPAQLLRSMIIIAPLILAGAGLIGYWLAGTASGRCRASWTRWTPSPTAGACTAASPCRCRPTRSPASRSRVNRMLARLEQSFASLHRFTADASHELKTPLMVLRAGVERALVHPGIPGEILRRSTKRWRRSTRCRSWWTTCSPWREPTRAGRRWPWRNRISATCWRTWPKPPGMLGESAGITVTSSMPEQPVLAGGGPAPDPGDAAQPGDQRRSSTRRKGGRSTWSSPRRHEDVTIVVRDTGIGIAPGDLPHIFDRFWRADPARSRTGERPGTGLGLAITKWIAEAHGGSITVQSRPGRLHVRLDRGLATSHGPRHLQRADAARSLIRVVMELSSRATEIAIGRGRSLLGTITLPPWRWSRVREPDRIAARSKKTRGADAMSVLVHGALISRRRKGDRRAWRRRPRQRPVDTTMVFLKPPPPPPPPPEQPPPDVVVSANPPPKGFQTVVAPTDIPKDIPPVDLDQKPFDPKDFTGKGVEGGIAKGIVGGTAPVDSGEVFLEAQPDDPVQPISIPDAALPAGAPERRDRGVPWICSTSWTPPARRSRPRSRC